MEVMTLQQYRDALGCSPFDIGRDKASRIWNVSRDTAKGILKKLRSEDLGYRQWAYVDMTSTQTDAVEKVKVPSLSVEQMWLPFIHATPVKAETITETKDTLSYDVPKTRIKTLDELIEAFNVDTSIWEIERWVANKWEVGYKRPDGEIGVEPLYQVKATFKRIYGWNKDTVEAEVERLKEEAKKDIKPFNINKITPVGSGGSSVLEISIPDTHIGGMAWSKETGQASWDHKIACMMYERAFEDLLFRGLKTADIGRIMLVVGNDLMNSDQQEPRTTKGTLIDQDSRWQKMYLAAWEAIKNSVDRAVQVAPTDVCIMPGNHDRLSMFGLGHSLECYYHGRKHVTIDNRPLYRKYYKMGVNMLAVAHGDTVKVKELPMLMAAEASEIFGSTKFRYAHIGHFHQEKLIEVPGVKIRIIPSLCPPNAWSVMCGYSGSMRGAQAFTWSLTDGPIAVTEHYIDMNQE